MLVFSRTIGEKTIINNDVVVTVLSVRGDRVRLGFEAPNDVPIHRGEIHAQLKREERTEIRSRARLAATD